MSPHPGFRAASRPDAGDGSGRVLFPAVARHQAVAGYIFGRPGSREDFVSESPPYKDSSSEDALPLMGPAEVRDCAGRHGVRETATLHRGHTDNASAEHGVNAADHVRTRCAAMVGFPRTRGVRQRYQLYRAFITFPQGTTTGWNGAFIVVGLSSFAEGLSPSSTVQQRPRASIIRS
jgi:hypothetical protein